MKEAPAKDQLAEVLVLCEEQRPPASASSSTRASSIPGSISRT